MTLEPHPVVGGLTRRGSKYYLKARKPWCRWARSFFGVSDYRSSHWTARTPEPMMGFRRRPPSGAATRTLPPADTWQATPYGHRLHP